MNKRQLDRLIEQNRGGNYAGMFTKGKQGGIEVNHFNFVPEREYVHLSDALIKLFGDEPLMLTDVRVTGAKPENVFSFWWEGNHDDEFLRCDREHIVKRVNSNGSVNRNKTLCHDKISRGLCNCSRVGRLHIRIPELNAMYGENVRFVIRTGSKRDIIEIGSQLRDAYDDYTLARGIKFRDIPFVLTRELDTWQEDDTDGTDEPQEHEHYFVKMRVSPDFVQKHGGGSNQTALSSPSHYNYVDTVERKMAVHMPFTTFEKICHWYGLSKDMFVKEYPDIETVKTMIMDYACETRQPVRLTHVFCNMWQLTSRNHFVYALNAGFADIESHERKIFKSRGWNTDNWKGDGKQSAIEQPIPVLIKPRKDGKGYAIDEVIEYSY